MIVKQINTKGFNESDIVNDERQMDIDDDNAPAPENIPLSSNDICNQIFNIWGHDDVCQCCQFGSQKIMYLFSIWA